VAERVIQVLVAHARVARHGEGGKDVGDLIAAVAVVGLMGYARHAAEPERTPLGIAVPELPTEVVARLPEAAAEGDQYLPRRTELAELVLEEAGVAVVPGEAFGTPGYFRLSYALGDDDLQKGVTRMAELLAEAEQPG